MTTLFAGTSLIMTDCVILLSRPIQHGCLILALRTGARCRRMHVRRDLWLCVCAAVFVAVFFTFNVITFVRQTVPASVPKALPWVSVHVGDLGTRYVNTFLHRFQKWHDDFLSWNATEFEGLEHFVVPANQVWLPDIVFKNRSKAHFKKKYLCFYFAARLHAPTESIAKKQFSLKKKSI